MNKPFDLARSKPTQTIFSTWCNMSRRQIALRQVEDISAERKFCAKTNTVEFEKTDTQKCWRQQFFCSKLVTKPGLNIKQDIQT